MSRQVHRGDGGELAIDFCFPASSSSRRRFLLRRREAGDWCAGVAAVDRGKAAGYLDMWSVLGWRWPAGGSGAVPRPRRRVDLDLEDEDQLGVIPRPTIHSERWVSLILLLVVHKALVAMELLHLRASWWLLFFVVPLVGVGVERQLCFGGAANPRVFFVFLFSFRGLSAICTGLRIWRGRISMCVRILYRICL